MEEYILALDLGTTSCRAVLYNRKFKEKTIVQKEISQYYPNKGWVEHDPVEIFNTTVSIISEVIEKSQISEKQIKSVGITNQRETVVVWNRFTGEPIYNAIVWQDTRTTKKCEEIINSGFDKAIHRKTGLVTDSYFTATKLQWILCNVSNANESAKNGDLLCGTIDTWILWKLTSGNSHLTDFTNASRTMLFNIIDLKWDNELLAYFGIPESILPKVKPSMSYFGTISCKLLEGLNIPVMGIAGDQQAALFGNACFNPGDAKCTYGTGCFLLVNTGSNAIISETGLLTTIACGTEGSPVYALEGSVFTAGSAIQWLRDGLCVISKASETGEIATNNKNEYRVFFVPAFSGLGSPYWNMNARGAILGITADTSYKDVVVATLEAIAFQVSDVVEVMQRETGGQKLNLYVDGGVSVNNYLMQFQADLLQSALQRNQNVETTALGAAMLAGLSSNFWTVQELTELNRGFVQFSPKMDSDFSQKLIERWKKAISSVIEFAK